MLLIVRKLSTKMYNNAKMYINIGDIDMLTVEKVILLNFNLLIFKQMQLIMMHILKITSYS